MASTSTRSTARKAGVPTSSAADLPRPITATPRHVFDILPLFMRLSDDMADQSLSRADRDAAKARMQLLYEEAEERPTRTLREFAAKAKMALLNPGTDEWEAVGNMADHAIAREADDSALRSLYGVHRALMANRIAGASHGTVRHAPTEIEDRIAATPARTAEGLAIKVQLVAGGTASPALVDSLHRDAAALAGAAAGSVSARPDPAMA